MRVSGGLSQASYVNVSVTLQKAEEEASHKLSVLRSFVEELVVFQKVRIFFMYITQLISDESDSMNGPIRPVTLLQKQV